MKIEKSLVWIKGIANNVDEEMFDMAFSGLTHTFDKTVAYIDKHKLNRDNRIADRINKELGINMQIDDYRIFYQLCHSYLHPIEYPQRLLFNPHLYKRIFGKVFYSGLCFNSHMIRYDWETPPEYNELNILPTNIGVLDYVIDETDKKVWYFSKLCDELHTDNWGDVCEYLATSIRGDNSRKAKRISTERFAWTKKTGAV